MRIFQDIDFFFGEGLRPRELKHQLKKINEAFIVNRKVINGVTYRSPTTRLITGVDLLSSRVVCSLLCTGVSLRINTSTDSFFSANEDLGGAGGQRAALGPSR